MSAQSLSKSYGKLILFFISDTFLLPLISLQSGEILDVRSIEEVLDGIYTNEQMHRLTRLDLFDMEGLQEEP